MASCTKRQRPCCCNSSMRCTGARCASSRRTSAGRLVSVVHQWPSSHHSPLVKRYVSSGVVPRCWPCGPNKATAWPPPVAMATRPSGANAKRMALSPWRCSAAGQAGVRVRRGRASVADSTCSTGLCRDQATRCPSGCAARMPALPASPACAAGTICWRRPCASSRQSASFTLSQTWFPGSTAKPHGPWMAAWRWLLHRARPTQRQASSSKPAPSDCQKRWLGALVAVSPSGLRMARPLSWLLLGRHSIHRGAAQASDGSVLLLIL